MAKHPLHSPFFLALAGLGLMTLAASASAATAELSAPAAKRFFNERGCNACHGLDEHRLAPAYQVISARYSGAYAADPANQVEKLATKIRYGGAGAWGAVPMISNPGLSEADARAIATWILNLQSPDSSGAKRD